MSVETLKAIVIDALEDIKAQEILEIDVHDKTSIADYMIIASGTSSRHLQALVENVSVKAKEKGFEPLGKEGDSGSEWVLIDFGDIVVHVMTPATRAYYDLERLWEGPRPSSTDAL
jgi:ribosome-associated protein